MKACSLEVQCVHFGAKVPGFKSCLCFTFPICTVVLWGNILASSHRMIVRAELVSVYKDVEECCSHKEVLRIKTFATSWIWLQPKCCFTVFRKHCRGSLPLTEGQRPALALAALSSYSGFSLPLTIWLVQIAAQTWAPVSALESGLACTPPGTEDSYQG